MKAKAIVIGVSAGGFETLQNLLPSFPVDSDISVFIVQHMQSNSGAFMVGHLDGLCEMSVRYAEDKAPIEKGVIYIAPPNYHLLVNEENRLALDVSERLNYSRPSIDVLFETASDFFREELIGVVLTGSNKDGSDGLKCIKENGGYTIVQDPDDAAFPQMPEFAVNIVQPHEVRTLEELKVLFSRINTFNYER